MIRITALFSGLLFTITLSFAQQSPEIKRKPYHLGISQGMGTNGLHDLSFYNDVAINLVSGQSYGNRFVLVTGMTHFIQQEAHGLLLTGFTSVVGGYPFLKRSRKVDSLASFQAIQLSGFMGAVHGEGMGAQVSGGFSFISDNLDGVQISGLWNATNGHFQGLQLAGGANTVRKFALGVQLSGVANRAQSMSGIQVSSLFNSVQNDLDGIQLGAFNYAGNVSSTIYRSNRFYWMQAGLINMAKSNGDGLQVGVVNYGKDIGFSQVGLINLSRNVSQYPVGLLNLSMNGIYFVRAYASRRYWYNLEFASGSNQLISGIAYRFGRLDGRREIGYAIGKIRYGGWNNYEYFADLFVYVNLHHDRFSDLLRPQPSFGMKYERGYNPFVMKRGLDLFVFAGLSYNLQHISIEPEMEGFLSWNMGNMINWFDLNIGVQL